MQLRKGVDAFDALSERRSRLLWVGDADIVAYPDVRTAKLERRVQQQLSTQMGSKDWWGNEVMLLTYDQVSYEAEQKLADVWTSMLSKKAEGLQRPDVHVSGAMEWEKNAWKVWDKKKLHEERRRDRYSTAMTSYIAGHALTHRFEPPAITQCAHCDIGGGIHPLRRCMGCMAVAYCCRMHQKVHWQWHKHICFAIRAANNLEAKRGEGAGWCKLRPRRWRRPPIESGAIVETNCRARWANWKQFYTNGAQSMLNQMGDGGPFVFKEWDEAIGSMAMCEEATFVFSVGATQRAMMPFVACRKAPPGTVLVVEVGLINVKRDGGRRQEVNDFLTQKFVAEQRQKKLDRLDEQKFMRLRMLQDRKDKSDSVMKLLKADIEKNGSMRRAQQDCMDMCTASERLSAAGASAHEAPGALSTPPVSPFVALPTMPAARVDGAAESLEVEDWDEETTLDYEGFGEEGGIFAPEEDLAAEPLSLPLVLIQETEIVTSTRATPPLHAAPHAPTFVPAPRFMGARSGYVFKAGSFGAGYYRDVAALTPLREDKCMYAGTVCAVDNLGIAPWDAASALGPQGCASSAGLPALTRRPDDPWASVDAVETRDAGDGVIEHTEPTFPMTTAQQRAVQTCSSSSAIPKATAGMPAPVATMRPILAACGLGAKVDTFEAAGLGNAIRVAALHRTDPQALSQQLVRLGMKMGQRQKLALALSKVLSVET